MVCPMMGDRSGIHFREGDDARRGDYRKFSELPLSKGHQQQTNILLASFFHRIEL